MYVLCICVIRKKWLIDVIVIINYMYLLVMYVNIMRLWDGLRVN